MAHNTSTNRIQINIDKAAQEVFPGFDCGSMIAVFPVGVYSFFSLIVFLLIHKIYSFGVTWQWLPVEREGALMRKGPPE